MADQNQTGTETPTTPPAGNTAPAQQAQQTVPQVAGNAHQQTVPGNTLPVRRQGWMTHMVSAIGYLVLSGLLLAVVGLTAYTAVRTVRTGGLTLWPWSDAMSIEYGFPMALEYTFLCDVTDVRTGETRRARNFNFLDRRIPRLVVWLEDRSGHAIEMRPRGRSATAYHTVTFFKIHASDTIEGMPVATTEGVRFRLDLATRGFSSQPHVGPCFPR
jgi:hypothetical protein